MSTTQEAARAPTAALAPSAPRPVTLTAREFLARQRRPIEPYVATADGRTVLLAADTTLLVAGPSGVGKSLAASFDLAGRLARDVDSDWLDLRVLARRRVLLLTFEGSDEDTADRVRALVHKDAHERFVVWDRWSGPDLPQDDNRGRQLLAEVLKRLSIDVVVFDTLTSFFGSAVGVDRGEEAHATLEDLRARSGRRFAAIVVAHTKKADRKGAKVDELEEIAGTFPRKADAAVVIRRIGDDEADPHRRVVFAKVRRGPQLRAKIATLPTDGDAPPRLELIGDAGGRSVKEGTDAEAIAEWITAQATPPAVRVVTARFGLTESTLRRRREGLEQLGIQRHKLPGQGNSFGYGTADQWRSLVLGEEAAA